VIVDSPTGPLVDLENNRNDADIDQLRAQLADAKAAVAALVEQNRNLEAKWGAEVEKTGDLSFQLLQARTTIQQSSAQQEEAAKLKANIADYERACSSSRARVAGPTVTRP